MDKSNICRELKYFLTNGIVDFGARETPPSIILKTDVPTGISSIPKADFTYVLIAVIKKRDDGDYYFEAHLLIDEVLRFIENIPFHEQTEHMDNNPRQFLLDSISNYISYNDGNL